MSVVFPSAVITEFYNGSAWVNISQYVVSDISGEGGFQSDSPADFTAGLGYSQFDLDNSGGLFTVYGGDSVRGLNTMSGWRKGAKIRHRVLFRGYEKVVWFGFVGDVDSDDGTWGDEKAHVTCVDWIDVASRYPMKRTEILTDKTLAEGAQNIVDRISIAPEGVDADSSSSTLPAIFDNVRGKTKALAEIDKLARSETGFVYVLKDGVLKVEGAGSRRGTDALTQVPVASENALLVSADNALLASADNALLVSELEYADLSITSEKLDLRMSDDYWNEAFVRTYPTRTDTSLKVLFQIGTPIPIAGGATIELSGNYTDPEGGNPVNGTNMQTPVAGTDYAMYANENGTGVTGTASLSITATYYGDLVDYRLTNTSASTYWLTRLQARGYGIYRNSYAENHIYITGSASTYGEKTFDLNQTYQTDPYAGRAYSASILGLYNTPKTRIVSARYNANLNSSHMLAFMYLDVGDLIKVYDNRSAMFKWFHITSRKFVIFLGGMIIVTFGLTEFVSINSGGLNPVAVDFARTVGSKDAIYFGNLPRIINDGQSKMSISLWIKPNGNAIGSLVTFGSTISGANDGFTFAITIDDLLVWSSLYAGFGGWSTNADLLTDNVWHHVVMTWDFSQVATDPIIYIDGSAIATTEDFTPNGSAKTRVGLPLRIGNVLLTNGTYTNQYRGQMYDVRIYDRVLSAAEVSAITNGGSPSMFVGSQDMVFQGLAINSDLGSGASLSGTTLPAGNNYFDNVLRYVGEPINSPVIQPAP